MSTLVKSLLLCMILRAGVAPSLTPPWLTCLQLQCRQYQHGQESTGAPHCCVRTGSLGVPAAVLWLCLMVLPRGTVVLTQNQLGRQHAFAAHLARSGDQ